MDLHPVLNHKVYKILVVKYHLVFLQIAIVGYYNLYTLQIVVFFLTISAKRMHNTPNDTNMFLVSYIYFLLV